jgi:hypothetical protein
MQLGPVGYPHLLYSLDFGLKELGAESDSTQHPADASHGPSGQKHGTGQRLRQPTLHIRRVPAYCHGLMRGVLGAGAYVYVSIVALPFPAAAAVNASEGGVKTAPGTVTGTDVRARCWQSGAKVIELTGFAAADLGRWREEAILLRAGAPNGSMVVLVPLGYVVCSIEVDN